VSDLDGTTRRAPAATADVDRARLAVAHHSTGPADCRLLLDMLGLLPEPPDQPEEQKGTAA
jgi:hypothetical protein